MGAGNFRTSTLLRKINQGADFPNVTGAQFGKLIHDEIRKWADVVKASGAKLE